MSDPTAPKQLDIVLDRASPVPLYHQLAQAIEAAIASGELVPGDRLENELSLTSRLGLARPTARQAIGELARKGLVVRKRGVGTQVLSAQISRETRLSSLYDDLVASGRHPQTRLLSYGIGPPGDEVLACGADIDETAEFITTKRLRLADGLPLAILVNHLPAWLDLTEDDLAKTPLYALLRARGLHLRVAHQTVSARLMTAEEAKLLTERRPAACLTALRVVYDDTGRLIEIGRHVYRASHYSLDVSLTP
ncbi:GntR family transcriptional regulator [Microlunatus sp. Gsoil 973]|jgi:DNA-binding GntR family transcriptional regulator|uniref:GntR family transcriptional regulator n=1 Tax=Microlunatus sp. Gsoil 973 TaxID=2672569 RepID=UPI0012B46590|nr:GntR family transcriptional regulator [Microlunatus sp. Gsoil 973]QGN31490.1 UTRA domain-containing protein [Microlunatus sp. Gsoil 973]